MKYFISAVVGGLLVWFIMAKPAEVRSVIAYLVDPKAASENGSKSASDSSSKNASNAASQTAPVAAATPPILEPAAVKQMSEANHISIETVRKNWNVTLDEQKRYHFMGTILLHIKDGHLLIRGAFPSYRGNVLPSGTYAVFGVPQAELMADGTPLDILTVPVGTYEHEGSTLYELVYTNHDKVGQ